MKGSIKRELFLAITAVAAIFVGILTFLNWAFYGDYYISTKKRDLVRMYTEVQSAYTGDPREIADTLTALEEASGVRVGITNRLGQDLYPFYYASITISGDMPGQRTFTIINPPKQDRWFGWMDRFSFDEKELLEKGYTFSVLQDKRSETQSVSLVGILNNGDRLILRLPVAYVEANTAFSSVFLFFSSLVTFLFCLVAAYYLSKRFSAPLTEIREVAVAMSELNFDKKYTGVRDDEIGLLGDSINTLSFHLETAIRDLRDINSRLETEIEEKQKIDDMRKEFIINVSHELKTPIALVQGYAEGLLVNINSSEEDKNYYCEVIMDESKRMNRLVTQLLALSKVELGNVTPEIADVKLSALCDKVVQKAMLLAKQKDLSIESGALDFMISCDLDMTEQVLTNYLTNAIDHTPQGGKIRIFGEEREGFVRVNVYNEGENIPEEETAKIWEKFYKIDKSRSRAFGGTGIGLSVVRTYMNAQRGCYGVENKEFGIQFYFELLKSKEPENEPAPAE